VTDSSPSLWVKSSYSDNGGSCVEWQPTRALATGVVPVRDSKNPAGPVLSVPAASFSAFVSGIKGGEFRI
jgi:hypothetical protein